MTVRILLIGVVLSVCALGCSHSSDGGDYSGHREDISADRPGNGLIAEVRESEGENHGICGRGESGEGGFYSIDCSSGGTVACAQCVEPPPSGVRCPVAKFPSSAVCDQCVESLCAQSCEGFVADPDSDDFLACTLSCAGNGCEENCQTFFPSAYDALSAWIECGNSQCEQECDPKLNPRACFVELNSFGCTLCAAKQCASTCTDYADLPNAGNYIDCVKPCMSDQDCVDDCAEQYPAESDAYMAYWDCAADQCVEACGTHGGCSLGGGLPVCDACNEQYCGMECAEVSRKGMHAYDACRNDCFPTETGYPEACLAECDKEFADVLDKWDAFLECRHTHCEEPCSIIN